VGPPSLTTKLSMSCPQYSTKPARCRGQNKTPSLRCGVAAVA
jgi:hypothetical protein